MIQDISGWLDELKELWAAAEQTGLNVKAKKEAAAALAKHQQWIVDSLATMGETMVRQALVAELAAHAKHYWDMGAMYDRTRELSEKAGEEGSGLIAEATMQVCRDVARRLNTRAAEVGGIDPAEAAFRDEAAAALGGEDDNGTRAD